MQDFLETITSGFKDVNKRLARLELSSANINEKLLRPEISKMFGENFSKQYTVNSLQGLVQLLSEANGLVMDREPSAIYFAARKISQDLAVKGIAKQLLSDFYDVISSNILDSFESQTHSGESEQRNENFVISEGDAIEVREENIHKSFCTAVVSRFQQLDAVNDRNQRILDAFTRPLALLQFPTKQKNRIHPLAFKLKLKLLCKLLTLPILDQKVKFLLKCNGPGIMIAQYTESKHIPVMIPHQNEPSNVNQSGEIKSQLKPIWRFLPPLELELDLKGSVTVIGKSALVEVAEIKSSSAKSRKGKGQLKSRAFVMRWALQQLCLEISEVTLAGRVLINNSDVSVAEQNYVDASGMSIFVHPM